MADIKASTLVERSNVLYEILNTYSNVYVPKIRELLAAFGLTEPLTIEQVAALDTRAQGKLQEAVGGFLAVMGKERGSRTLEDILAGVGYGSVMEAYADVPNHFTGETARIIQTNMALTGETVALLDSLVEAALLFSLLGGIVQIGNKVADVAPRMDRV